LSFLEIFPRSFFGALPLPCLRGLKSSMSVTTAASYPLPAMSKLLLVGKWFLVRFFGNLFIARFLIKSPCRAPPPTLTPKNCNGWLLHAPGITNIEMSSGEEVATHWLPPSLARSSPVSQAGSESSKILPQHCPPPANLLPYPPS